MMVKVGTSAPLALIPLTKNYILTLKLKLAPQKNPKCKPPSEKRVSIDVPALCYNRSSQTQTGLQTVFNNFPNMITKIFCGTTSSDHLNS